MRRCLFACCSRRARPAADTAAAPRRPFGDGKSVIRISARSLLRWQQDGTTLLDLQGNANLYPGQFQDRVSAPAGLVQESEQGGGKVAVLEAYGEKGTTLLEDGKQSALDGRR